MQAPHVTRIEAELLECVLRTAIVDPPETSLECLARLRKLGPNLAGEPSQVSRLRAALERQVHPTFLPASVGRRPLTKRALGGWHYRLYRWLGCLNVQGELIQVRDAP